jgi:hypothetical protein
MASGITRAVTQACRPSSVLTRHGSCDLRVDRGPRSPLIDGARFLVARGGDHGAAEFRRGR